MAQRLAILVQVHVCNIMQIRTLTPDDNMSPYSQFINITQAPHESARRPPPPAHGRAGQMPSDLLLLLLLMLLPPLPSLLLSSLLVALLASHCGPSAATARSG